MWHTIQSSLLELLAAGFKYTIPLALVSFFWGLLIALFVALIRLSRQNGAFKILKGMQSFMSGCFVQRHYWSSCSSSFSAYRIWLYQGSFLPACSSSRLLLG